MKNTPPPNTTAEEKNYTYYPSWLKTLQNATNYHGAITDLSKFVAQKRGKTMDNLRPHIYKIVKGERACSAEYLLIIQDWMNSKT